MNSYQDTDLIKSLQELAVISQSELDRCTHESQSSGRSLADVLIDNDLISPEDLAKVVSDIIGIPFVDLSSTPIDQQVLSLVPEIVAKKQQVIPYKRDQDGLYLAMIDPGNREIIEFLQKKTGITIIPSIITLGDFSQAINLYTVSVETAFDDIIKTNIEQVRGATSDLSVDPPIIKIVETIISYGYKNRASDIHIEPQDHGLLVRFRIDGVLHDIITLPIAIHQQVVTRVKIMSRLRTDEHQAAQDGKLQFQTDEELLDIRVSIVPIVQGEKIVMRLLSEKSRQFSLLSLGFDEDDMAKIRSAYEKPHGMILSTGPTGCGKTTTMYAILKLLNKRDINIMTIEDPVEYDIEGINQIQVNAKTELTFAKGLRSILRQDPNVILVGEVRDSETAGIATNAAMTGHLVLSTLHTNDAATAIPRLLDMGIEPFLVASTVNLIIAQRLVRKICPNCRHSIEIDRRELSQHFSSASIDKFWGKASKVVRVYRGKGCSVCHQTGYQDRLGIFEIMIVNEELRQAISQHQDSDSISRLARKLGMRTMVEDGVNKIKGGLTTIDEIIRVTKGEL